jgi:hypothetical protein
MSSTTETRSFSLCAHRVYKCAHVCVFVSIHTHIQRRIVREREADGNTGLVIKLEPTLSCVRVSRNYYLQIGGEERERRLWSWLQHAQIHESILALLLLLGIMRHSINPSTAECAILFHLNVGHICLK